MALLRFADDIAIMAETEEDLQCMLTTLHTWYESWWLYVNTSIAKILGINPSLEPHLSLNVAPQK